MRLPMLLIHCVLTLLALAVPAIAQGAPTYRLTGGQWFDGSGFVRAQWYVVDGRLTRTAPARVDVTIALDGRFIVPPLADAHQHDVQSLADAPAARQAYLRRGIHASLQMCASPVDSRHLGAAFNHPGTLDVVVANACLSSSDGHPLGVILAAMKRWNPAVTPQDVHGRGYFAIDTAADVERQWASIAELHPTMVKLVLVDSARHAQRQADPATFGQNGLDPALVPDLVRRAHAAGARVAAHVETAHDVQVAVDAGVDLIAHLPGNRLLAGTGASDYRLDDALIARAVQRGVVFVTTSAVMATRRAGVDVLRPVHVDNLARLRRAGARIALGSDLHGGSVVDELLHLDALGVFPRAELLRTAFDTARMITPDRSVGTLSEGAEPSFLVLRANPLDDLRAFDTISLQMKQGALLAVDAPAPAVAGAR